MIDTQSPTPTCRWCASSAPSAMRPTLSVVLRGVPDGQRAAGRLLQRLDAARDERPPQVVGPLLDVDPFEVGADTADHHLARREQELRHPDHARRPAQARLDLGDLGPVDVGVAVGHDDEVRVERQHLVLELALEPARHAQHHDQRRDAQHHPHRRDGGEDREGPQQERHHRDQPARQDRQHRHRLDRARASVRQREHAEPEGHQQPAPATSATRAPRERRPRCR